MLIATTVISSIITSVSKKSVENIAYGIIRAGDIYYSRKEMKGEELENEVFNFPNDVGNLEIKGKLPENGNMKINEKGDISLAITDRKYCVTKGYKENKVTITENKEECVLPVTITNIVLSNEALTLDIGQTSKVDASFEPEDVSDTANATPTSYSISYNLNGGSASNPTSYNVTTATFTLKNPTRTGYTFTGWTGSNGSTASTSVSIVRGSTGNKNYTANWTTGPNCYMVTWEVADCWSETSGGSSQARPQAGFLIDVVDDSDDDAARWKISAYSYPDKAYKSCITCYIPRGSLSFYSAGPCPDQPTNYC